MSWHYSQALEEAYSAGNFLDGKPSARSNGMPTHETFWSPDKTMDVSNRSRSGMTYKPLTGDHGEDVLTWCLAASHARTSPPLEKVPESTEPAPAYGVRWLESFARFDLQASSWKTHQFSLLVGLESFLETWPRWGMMRAGECWALSMPDTITNENESGLLPTLLATDWKGGTTAVRKDRGNLRFDQWRDYVKIKYGMTYPHPTHSELRMGWPVGWTDCAASATDKFPLWLLLHGKL